VDIKVYNVKGQKATSIKYNDFRLATDELEFEVDDNLTYALLCYAGPKLVLEQITPILEDKLAPGPYRLSRDINQPKMINVSACGDILFIALTFPKLHDRLEKVDYPRASRAHLQIREDCSLGKKHLMCMTPLVHLPHRFLNLTPALLNHSSQLVNRPPEHQQSNPPPSFTASLPSRIL
jgi:hypothetical protein